MAEQSGNVFMNALRSVGNRVNPVNIARNTWDRATTHPFQTGISTLLGLVNPLLGTAARTGFSRHNTNKFNQGAEQLLSDSGDRLNSQIWGNLGVGPYQSAPGNMGSMGGMAGITSPNTYHSSPQSQLAQMLGLNNYQGNSSGNGLPGITSPVPEGQGPNAAPAATQPSQILPSIGVAPSMGHQGGGFSGGPSFGYSGDTASGAHGTIGSGARQASMEGVQAMLGAGLGKRPLMPFHEINDERAQARAAGMSLAQYRASLGA